MVWKLKNLDGTQILEGPGVYILMHPVLSKRCILCTYAIFGGIAHPFVFPLKQLKQEIDDFADKALEKSFCSIDSKDHFEIKLIELKQNILHYFFRFQSIQCQKEDSKEHSSLIQILAQLIKNNLIRLAHLLCCYPMQPQTKEARPYHTNSYR